MKIGIVGLGVVGKANQFGFGNLGHEIFIHDKNLQTNLSDVLNADIAYLCLPTPSNHDGSCDTSIIEEVIASLDQFKYKGVIAIRSTVIPGFTYSMIEKFKNLKICFVPEFLRERCAEEDFLKNHKLLAVGTNDIEISALIVKSHGNLPETSVVMTPTEAEFLKYFNNVYAALKVTFANNIYEIATKMGCDYTKIKDAYLKTGKSSGHYLDVNNELRGYGGMCLPKDTKALAHLIKASQLPLKLIESIDADNSKYKTTLFPGMRG